jgi:hypothetical protein
MAGRGPDTIDDAHHVVDRTAVGADLYSDLSLWILVHLVESLHDKLKGALVDVVVKVDYSFSEVDVALEDVVIVIGVSFTSHIVSFQVLKVRPISHGRSYRARLSHTIEATLEPLNREQYRITD